MKQKTHSKTLKRVLSMLMCLIMVFGIVNPALSIIDFSLSAKAASGDFAIMKSNLVADIGEGSITTFLSPNTSHTIAEYIGYVTADSTSGGMKFTELESYYAAAISNSNKTSNITIFMDHLTWTDKLAFYYSQMADGDTVAGLTKAQLGQKIVGLLKYWLYYNFKDGSGNWWYNELTIPNLVGEIALLVEGLLDSSTKTSAANIVALGCFTTSSNTTITGATGANEAWLSSSTLKYAMLTSDETALNSGYTHLKESISVVGGGRDGISSDGSFTQHGARLYTGGYGQNLINYAATAILLLEGTSKELTEADLKDFTKLILEGMQYFTIGDKLDPQTIGRELFRDGKTDASGAADYLEKLLFVENLPDKSEIRTYIESLSKNKRQNLGLDYFENVEYITINNEDFYFGFHGAAGNLYYGENLNHENQLAYNTSYGTTTTIAGTNVDFNSLIPVKDYAKISGTTAIWEENFGNTNPTQLALYQNHQGSNTEEALYNKRKLGGVFGGEQYGGMAITFADANVTDDSGDTSQFGYKYKVACFATNESAIILGTDLKNNNSATMSTTIQQEIAQVSSAPSETTNSDGSKSLVHNGVKYTLYPAYSSDTSFNSTVANQTGTWSRLKASSDKTSHTESVFTLSLDTPNNGKYAYSVQSTNSKETYKVIKNDSTAQAVLMPDGRVASVFYADGSFEYGGTTFTGKAGECYCSTLSGASNVVEGLAGSANIAVPETIYVNPSDNKTFQYYVNNNMSVDGNSISLAKESSQTKGRVYFYKAGASSLSISLEGLSSGDFSSAVTTTNCSSKVEIATTNTPVLSTALTAGQSKALKWTFTYVLDGVTYTSYAYSVVYAPYTGLAGALGQAKNGYAVWGNAYVGSMLWWQGIHGVDKYASTTCNITSQSTDDNYTMVPDTSKLNPVAGVIGATGSTDNPNKWFSKTTSNPTFTYVAYGSNGQGWRTIYSTGATASVTVDSSRYDNLNQIPNLKTGFYLTNDQDMTDSSNMTYSLTKYTGETYHGCGASDDVNHHIANPSCSDYEQSDIIYNGANADLVVSQGSYDTSKILYNGQVNYGVSGTDTKSFSLHGYVQGHRTSCNFAFAANSLYAPINVHCVDKSKLRAEVQTAINLAGAYGNAAYNTAYENGAYILGKPDSTQTQVDTATANLKSAREAAASAGSTYVNVNTVAKYGEKVLASSSTQVVSGHTARVFPSNIPGYTFVNSSYYEYTNMNFNVDTFISQANAHATDSTTYTKISSDSFSILGTAKSESYNYPPNSSGSRQYGYRIAVTAGKTYRLSYTATGSSAKVCLMYADGYKYAGSGDHEECTNLGNVSIVLTVPEGKNYAFFKFGNMTKNSTTTFSNIKFEEVTETVKTDNPIILSSVTSDKSIQLNYVPKTYDLLFDNEFDFDYAGFSSASNATYSIDYTTNSFTLTATGSSEVYMNTNSNAMVLQEGHTYRFSYDFQTSSSAIPRFTILTGGEGIGYYTNLSNYNTYCESLASGGTFTIPAGRPNVILRPGMNNVAAGNTATYSNIRVQDVTYDSKLNTAQPNAQVTYDEPVGVGTLPTLNVEGYIFDGWFTGRNGTGTKYTSATVYQVAGDTKLYSNMRRMNTVSFDNLFIFDAYADSQSPLNGNNIGSGATVNTEAGSITIPTGTGSDPFTSWSSADGYYSINVTPGTKYYFIFDTTTGGNFYVNFNGGNVSGYTKGVETNFDTKGTTYAGSGTYANGQNVFYITAPTGATKMGFRFGGAGKTFSNIRMIDEAHYYSNVDYSSVEDIHVINQGKYGTLPTLTRTGYTFDGWYLESDYGKRVDTDTGEVVYAALPVTSTSVVALYGDATLYSKWTPNKYTVDFNKNMFDFSKLTGSETWTNKEIQSGTVTADKAAETYTITRNGTVWRSGNNDTNGTYYIPVTAGQTYVYSFDVDKYDSPADLYTNAYIFFKNSSKGNVAPGGTYKFYVNGEEKSIENSSAYYAHINDTLTTVTTKHYDVEFTVPSGVSYVSFGYNARTNTPSTVTTGTFTYKNIQFQLKSDFDGSYALASPTAVTYDSALPTVKVPYRNYYTFNGYYDAKSGGTKYYNANGTSARIWNKTSNANLYAQWTGNDYNVYYNENHDSIGVNYFGGKTFSQSTAVNGITYSYNQQTGIVTVNGTQTTDVAKMMLIPFTPEAGATYRFSVEVVGGSATLGGCMVVEASNASGASLSTRLKLDFKGTSTGANGSTSITFTSALASETKTLRLWTWNNSGNTFNNYQIKIKVEKGSTKTAFSQPATIATHGNAMPAISVPTRTGYTFDGYYDAATGGTQYYTSTGSSARTWDKGSATLYAHWTPITKTAYYDENHDNIGVNLFNSGTVDTTLWNGNDGNTNTNTTSNPSQITNGVTVTNNNDGTITLNGQAGVTSMQAIYVGFKPEKGSTYLVKVEKVSGTVSDNRTPTVQPTYEDKSVNLSGTGGSEFDNNAYKGGIGSTWWTFGSDGTLSCKQNSNAAATSGTYNTSHTVSYLKIWFWRSTSDTKVYNFDNCKYRISIYKVNALGDTVAVGNSLAAEYKTYDLTSATTRLPSSRTGYDFTGWFDAATGGTKYNNTNGSSAKNWDKTTDTTLYAQWNAHSYNISYNYASGTKGATNPATATFDTPFYVSAPTRTAYTFAGWKVASTNLNTSTAKWGTTSSPATAVAANTPYSNGATGNVYFKNLASDNNVTVTLTAAWTTVPYTVTYENAAANNGVTKTITGFPTTAQSYDIESTATLANITAPTGYTFGGWKVKATVGNWTAGTILPAGTSLTGKYGNVTVTPVLTATTTTVTFSPMNGDTSWGSAVTATYDLAMPAISTTAPTRNGYTFAGWYDAQTGGTQYYTAAGASARTWDKTGATCTLYAHWTLNPYTVTYEDAAASNGKNKNVTMPGQLSYNIESTATISTITPPTGYSFGGWKVKTTVGNWTAGTTIAAGTAVTGKYGNVTLNPIWTPNSYTVSFNYNKPSTSTQTMTGNGTASKSVTFDAAYGTLPTPVMPGYTFNGWFTAATGGTQVTAETVVATASAHTLYAHWTANTWTVTFNTNKPSTSSQTPSVSPASKSVTFDSTYGELPTPTMTGYTFNGWYTAAVDGTAVTSSTAVLTDAAHSIYAHWTANTYTIVFAGGENYTSGSTASKTNVAFDTAVKLTSNGFKKTGWTFKGWIVTTGLNTATAKYGSSSSPTTAVTATTKINNSYYVKNLTAENGATVTLTAQWAKTTYFISYDENTTASKAAEPVIDLGTAQTPYSTLSGVTVTTTYDATTKIITYVINGTYNNTGNTSSVTKYPACYKMASSLTKETSYRISTNFVSGTAYVSAESASKVTSPTCSTATTGSLYSALVGLNTSSNGVTYYSTVYGNTAKEFPVRTAFTSTSVQYAVLRLTVPAKRAITFDNYTITMKVTQMPIAPTKATYQDPVTGITGKSDLVSKIGYTFDKWNTKTDGSGTTYTENMTYPTANNVTVYPCWKVINYPITYVNAAADNGLTVGTMPASGTYTITAAKTLATPTAVTGYAFKGWNLAVSNHTGESSSILKNTSTSKQTTITKGSYGDVTATAVWTANKYTIKFNANGGTGTMSDKSMTYGIASTLTQNAFTRSGYIFIGWTTAADGSGTKYKDKQSVNNLTATNGATVNLYAQWGKIEVDLGIDEDALTISANEEVSNDTIIGSDLGKWASRKIEGYTFNDVSTVTTGANAYKAVENDGVKSSETNKTIAAGTISYSADSDGKGSIFFKPKTTIGATVTTIVARIRNIYNGDSYITYSPIHIVPQTTIFFDQDDAGTPNNGKTTTGGTIAWSTMGTKSTSGEATAAPVYGYSSTYIDDTAFSGGSESIVNVANGQVVTSGGSTSGSWPTYTYEFKGTGCTLYSTCYDQSGLMTVLLEKKVTNGDGSTSYTKVANATAINTYYKDGTNTYLYQAPVYTKNGLDYADYRVTVTAVYNYYFDNTVAEIKSTGLDDNKVESGDVVDLSADLGKNYANCEYISVNDGEGTSSDGLNMSNYEAAVVGEGRNLPTSEAGSYNVCIDGVRIYNPAGVGSSLTNSDIIAKYTEDNELNPTYIDIRTKLGKTLTFGDNTALYISNYRESGATGAIWETYSTKGANHEVILSNNGAIAFNINDFSNVNEVHVSLRVPRADTNSTAAITVYDSDGKISKELEIPVSSTTEQFYDITNYINASGLVTIRCKAGLISVSTIKIIANNSWTGNGVAVSSSQDTVDAATAMMLNLLDNPIPDKTDVTFNVKLGNKTVKKTVAAEKLTVQMNGDEYKLTSTLTADEISGMLESAGLADSYSIKDNKDVTLTAVYDGEKWVPQDVSIELLAVEVTDLVFDVNFTGVGTTSITIAKEDLTVTDVDGKLVATAVLTPEQVLDVFNGMRPSGNYSIKTSGNVTLTAERVNGEWQTKSVQIEVQDLDNTSDDGATTKTVSDRIREFFVNIFKGLFGKLSLVK